MILPPENDLIFITITGGLKIATRTKIFEDKIPPPECRLGDRRPEPPSCCFLRRTVIKGVLEYVPSSHTNLGSPLGLSKKGRVLNPPLTYGRRGILVMFSHRYYSRCAWDLARPEKAAAEEVDHSVLYDEGPVLLQHRAEAGQVGQFVEIGVCTGDPVEVAQAAE